jgi:hypothetical protein
VCGDVTHQENSATCFGCSHFGAATFKHFHFEAGDFACSDFETGGFVHFDVVRFDFDCFDFQFATLENINKFYLKCDLMCMVVYVLIYVERFKSIERICVVKVTRNRLISCNTNQVRASKDCVNMDNV